MNSDNEYVSISELRNAFKSVTGDCTCPLHIAATIDQILGSRQDLCAKLFAGSG